MRRSPLQPYPMRVSGVENVNPAGSIADRARVPARPHRQQESDSWPSLHPAAVSIVESSYGKVWPAEASFCGCTMADST